MNYVSSWGYKEAIREIVQNFMDYGDYQREINVDKQLILYSNDYLPTDTNFLKIGFTQKNNPNAIGKHGEGIKMALLVLHRLGLDVYITTVIDGFMYTFTPTTYDDPMLGKCFGILYSVTDSTSQYIRDNFSVGVSLTPEFNEMNDYFIDSNTSVLFKCSYGEIIDKPAGNIYVGGIFVTNYWMDK
jgi:hypothetical protein